jgi:hypothetical protein
VRANTTEDIVYVEKRPQSNPRDSPNFRYLEPGCCAVQRWRRARPTYTPHGSYSNKGAIIGGIAGGAAVVGGLLYWKQHNRAKLQGCLIGSGDKLVSDQGNKTYSLTNKQNETLKPGTRVELLGKKAKDDSGEPTFEVHKMSKDLGQCTATTAAK